MPPKNAQQVSHLMEKKTALKTAIRENFQATQAIMAQHRHFHKSKVSEFSASIKLLRKKKERQLRAVSRVNQDLIEILPADPVPLPADPVPLPADLVPLPAADPVPLPPADPAPLD
jgi:hypothetical protein